jgi:hypothetical protein
MLRIKDNDGAELPIKPVMAWTSVWVFFLVGLVAIGTFADGVIPYEAARIFRRLAAGLLVVLAVWGLLAALGGAADANGPPWYTSTLLLSLVLFWGLAPPAWFFTEYYLIDTHTLSPHPDTAAAMAAALAAKNPGEAARLHADLLASTKTYADLASKVWLAVGAALASAITLVKR